MRALPWIFLLAFGVTAYCASQAVKNHVLVECPPDDLVCVKDRIGFDAISQLHVQIDDDHNGNLDRSESDEFIRDELKYEDGFDRHSNFHGNDDLISIDDLWKLWIQSEVYNWTVDDVVDWVVSHVELPQYSEHIKVNAVDGRTLPRIAANVQYVTNILGIKNPVHRQKLSLKSMDLVLFGAPKRHNYMKDVALVASLLIACGGCWLAYVQHKYSQKHLRKVMKDLDTLHKAEDAFTKLKVKLDQAQEQQQEVEVEKRTLEAKMNAEIEQAKNEADRLRSTRETTEEEMSRLRLAEEELIQVRSALRKAQKELQVHHSGMPLAELQNWLQMTYEIETRHYDAKREAAERQLLIAKEMCEKIRKKRNAFLGSLRIAHTTSIDDTDHMIMSARAALEEIKMDLQERSHRWQQIENICSFSILHNPGMHCLEALLKSSTGHPYAGGSSSLLNSRGLSSSMMAPLNVDDADEDSPPGGMTSAVAFYSAPQGHPLSSVSSAPGMHSMGTSLTGERRTMLPPSSTTSSVRRPPLASIPSEDKESSEPRTDSEENLSQNSVGKSANGTVQFNLGGPSDTLLVDDDSRERANSVGKSYQQSVSLDTGTTRSLPRPQTLPSSLSDGAFSATPHSASSPTGSTHTNKGSTYRRPTSTISMSSTTPSLEDNSSPESTDSAMGKGEVEKRKKKKKLFSKILGREKQKAN